MTDTQQQSRFYNFVEGVQRIYLSDIKAVHDEEKGRNQVKMTWKSQPGLEAPYTQYTLRLPKKDDGELTKVMMDRAVKAVLYPLAGLKPDDNGVWPKAKASEIFRTIKGGLQDYDIACDVNVKLTQGKSLDRNGEPIMFAEILSVLPVDAVQKVPYESDIDYDALDDLAF